MLQTHCHAGLPPASPWTAWGISAAGTVLGLRPAKWCQPSGRLYSFPYLLLAINLVGRTKLISGVPQRITSWWLMSSPFRCPAVTHGQRTCWLQYKIKRSFKNQLAIPLTAGTIPCLIVKLNTIRKFLFIPLELLCNFSERNHIRHWGIISLIYRVAHAWNPLGN